MAIGVLVLGESGTGKTYGTKGFDPSEVKILSVKKPILPFKGKYELVKTPTGDDIIRELKNTKKKCIVIDDFQYILGVQMMKRIGEKGWDKFNEIQQPYSDVLDAIDSLPDDVIVYINSHVERDEEGKKKIKTIGKALDKYLTVEGLFMIVLGTLVVDGKYYFTTQNSGNDTCKSPEGMFPSFAISNDLKYVDDKIRNYYQIGDFKSDEEMVSEDEANKSEVSTEKKSRRRKKDEEKEESTEAPKEEEEEEKPKRSRRTKEEEEEPKTLKEQREEVRKRNGRKIAEANTTEDGEGIPFDEAEEPKTEQLPKRKSRKVPETSEEESKDEPEKIPKRRRRRE